MVPKKSHTELFSHDQGIAFKCSGFGETIIPNLSRDLFRVRRFYKHERKEIYLKHCHT